MRSSMKSQGTVPAFLLKTYEILENPEYEDIISWNRDGNAFTVKNLNEFSEKVLPKYFKHNNFASFVRQLNMYDFHKSRHENNENEFRHKLFKRGQKHLLSEIKRKIGEGHGHSNQLVPASRDFSVDKFKKETAKFTDELGSIRRHHNDLEKVTKVIYNQNSQLLKENKLLWNELGKNKEKYEKKVEKLMMFIFSVTHNQDNQLGPSEERKMLTNAEMTQAFNEFTKDTDQGKPLFDEAGNTTLPALQDSKSNDKLLQNISNYLEDKGNDSNLDSILNQFQKDDMSNLFKNQPESVTQFNLQEQQNLNPNADAGVPRRRSGRRRGGPTPISTLPNEGPNFAGTPTKQVKTEAPVEPLYNYQQNLMNAQAPINMMNNMPSEEALRRDLPDFSLGLSRGPSFVENDPSSLRAPQLVQQKSSNDFLMSSPKPFLNQMRDDSFNDLYGANRKDEDKGQNLGLDKNNSQSNNDLMQNFSPPFMNNNQNTYNFGQSFDDSVYRS